jgi:predicted TIM-barrel fold metal-dependent hydrolase
MFFIDVHHHLIGKNNPNAASLPQWNIELDMESMDRMGLTNVVLSLPVAGAPEQNRAINDMIASLAAKDPKRYGMLACLPSAHVDAALKEIEYTCDTLKADGFIMPSNAGEIYIGDDRMDEILAELNRRSAVVLIHPTKAGGEIPSMLVTDLSTYEYPFDTTRAVIDLVYSDKIQKYPNIKWIVSHAGGVLPYITHRLSTVAQENKTMPLTSDEVMASLKTLYYDVALSTVPYVFATLKELFGTSHIVFGTDAPLRYEGPVTESIQQLKSYPGFDEADMKKIMSETAKELFPRFR